MNETDKCSQVRATNVFVCNVRRCSDPDVNKNTIFDTFADQPNLGSCFVVMFITITIYIHIKTGLWHTYVDK